MKTLLKLTFLLLLVGCSSTRTSVPKSDNLNDNLLIGTWIIERSTLNGQTSPIPSNTSLKFTTDNRMSLSLPGLGSNGKDMVGTGEWEKNDNTIVIEYDDKAFSSAKQRWEIIKLTESKLHWKMDLDGRIHEEIYTRKRSL